MSRLLILAILPLFVGCTPVVSGEPEVKAATKAPAKADPIVKTADWPVFRGTGTMQGTGTTKLPDQLEEKWYFKCTDAVECAPAIVDGVVYIASMDKHAYALDLASGKLKWKTKLDPMKSSPAVKGKRVYVGDCSGVVYSLDIETGKVQWKYETAGEITSGANFHGENILIGSHDSKLHCIDVNGKKVWEYEIDGPVNGSPSVIGDVTFVAGCDSVMHAVDAKTGKNLWTLELPGQAGATAAIANDMAFVGLMTNDVIGINLKTKKQEWIFTPQRRAQPFYASAAIGGDIVVTGSRDKKVYALDRKTGKELWNFVTEGMVDASPTIVGNRVYIGCLSSTSEFYVLDLATGKKIQELSLDSPVSGSVAVGPDCIIVGTEKGGVYCLGKK